MITFAALVYLLVALLSVLALCAAAKRVRPFRIRRRITHIKPQWRRDDAFTF